MSNEVTVRELIEMLSKLDGNAIVFVDDSDGHSYYKATDVCQFEKGGENYVIIS